MFPEGGATLSRAKRAADRIREEIPLIQVLADYGYDVEPRVQDREQQFRCDLHGDGSDGKPSARYYPDGGQFFCFACGSSRDAVALVQEKEGKSFWEAVSLLEARYGLPPLPWQASDDKREPTVADQVKAALRPAESPEGALSRLERFLMGITQERSLPPERCAGFWEGYDRVGAYFRAEGDPSKVIEMAYRILGSAKDALGIPQE